MFWYHEFCTYTEGRFVFILVVQDRFVVCSCRSSFVLTVKIRFVVCSGSSGFVLTQKVDLVCSGSLTCVLMLKFYSGCALVASV